MNKTITSVEEDVLTFHLLNKNVSFPNIPFLESNDAELLIDGEATFDSIKKGIADAQEYILFQFFIVHDDELGRSLKDALIARAGDLVPVDKRVPECGSQLAGNVVAERDAELGNHDDVSLFVPPDVRLLSQQSAEEGRRARTGHRGDRRPVYQNATAGATQGHFDHAFHRPAADLFLIGHAQLRTVKVVLGIE